jgi:hypothetical protein
MTNVFKCDFQFYPTPPELATKAWAKFKNKEFIRVLEPSAGNGDLIKAMPYFSSRYRQDIPVDCCEIDLAKHPTLRAIPGVSIVGMDFLEFGGGAIYSHFVLNPPFAAGVSHVLKAWNCAWDAEIVAIIGAESLRNPFSTERKHLLSLIDQFGEVEFIEGAFAGDDAQRKTNVEIALVYLRKVSNLGESIVGTLLTDLQGEDAKVKAERLAQGYEQMQELAIPSTEIENLVLAFDAAVRSMRASVMAEGCAKHYSNLLGATMAERTSEMGLSTPADSTVSWVKSEIVSRYLTLKDKAWAGMLRSSQVTSKLSSKAQKRVESEFEQIKELEFSVSNVFGFLRGLMECHGQIKLDMACDIFDLITRYHTDNLCFYKGWRSNDKQRTCGMRLKTTRFVIPGNLNYAGSSSLSWDAERRLADIDKVLAMLDGRQEPEVSLVEVFRNHMSDLRNGGRVSGSYMDVRFYPGAGTIHFFPTNKTVVDRLNKLVGEHRKWLPPADANVSKSFREQYEKAEKFDKALRAELDTRERTKQQTGMRISRWEHPLQGLFQSDRSERSSVAIDEAMTAVLERNGISVDFQLEGSTPADEQGQLLLLAA